MVIIFFAIFCILAHYIIMGKAMGYLLYHRHVHLCEAGLTGFVWWWAIITVAYSPAMFFETSYTTIYIITVILVIGIDLALALIFIKIKRKDSGIIINFDKSDDRGNKTVQMIINIIAVLLFVYQIYHLMAYSFVSSDDGFYVGMVTTFLGEDKLYCYEPSMGYPEFYFFSHYKMVSYELFWGVICKITSLNAATVFHSIASIVNNCIFNMALLTLCKKISKKNYIWLYIVGIILAMFTGEFSKCPEVYILIKSWYGKAAFSAIVLMGVLIYFLEFSESTDINWKKQIYIIALLYCGFGLTTMGLFFGPIICGMYMLIYMLFVKSVKPIKGFLIPILACVPYVCARGIIIFTGTDYVQFTSGAQNLDYIQQLNTYVSDRFFFYLWFAAILIVLAFGKRIYKFYIGVYVIVLFLTVLNPLFMTFLAQYVTGTSVYWRLFWLFQWLPTIIIALEIVIERLKYKYTKIFCGIIVLGMVACFTSNLYTVKNHSIKASNMEHLSNITLKTVETIFADWQEVDKPVVLMPSNYAHGVRQITDGIKVAWTKYRRNFKVHLGGEQFYQIWNQYYNDLYNRNDMTHFEEMVRNFNVDYVVLSEKNKNLPKWLLKLEQCKDFIIYKVK